MAFRTIEEIEDEIKQQFAFALKNDSIQAKDFLKAAKMNLERALRLIDYMKYSLDYSSFDGRINESLLKAIREGEYRGIGPNNFCNNNIIGYYCAIMDRGFKKETMKPTDNIYHVDKHTMNVLLQDMIKNDKYDPEFIRIAHRVLDKDKVNALIMDSILKTLKPENAYILNKIDISPEQKDNLYPKLINKYKLLKKDIPIEYRRNSHILLALVENGDKNALKVGGNFQDDFSEVSQEYVSRLTKAVSSNLDVLNVLVSEKDAISLNPNILLTLRNTYKSLVSDNSMSTIVTSKILQHKHKKFSVEELATIFSAFDINKTHKSMIFNEATTIFSKDNDAQKIETIEKLNILPTNFGLDFVIRNSKQLTDKKLIDEVDNELLKTFNEEYSKEKEEKLMKLLGKDQTVEEYIQSILKKKANELTIKDMAVMVTYSQKRLLELGVNDVKVQYSEVANNTIGGFYAHSNKTLTLSTSINNSPNGHDVATLVEVIHHETNHAKQYKDVEEMNTDEEDLLEYSIDILLMGLIPDYYQRNYRSMSFEFDADHKAFIDVSIKYAGKSPKLADPKIYPTLAENYNKQEMFKKSLYRVLSDDGEKVDLYTILDQIITGTKRENPRGYKAVLEGIAKTAPIIGYLYDLSTGERRDVTQLFNLYDKSSDEKEKKIYSYLIYNLCDKRKHKDASTNIYKVSELAHHRYGGSLFGASEETYKKFPILKNIGEDKKRYQKYAEHYIEEVEKIGVKINELEKIFIRNGISQIR